MPFLDPAEKDKIEEFMRLRFIDAGAELGNPESIGEALVAVVEELFDQTPTESQDTMLAYVDTEVGA